MCHHSVPPCQGGETGFSHTLLARLSSSQIEESRPQERRTRWNATGLLTATPISLSQRTSGRITWNPSTDPRSAPTSTTRGNLSPSLAPPVGSKTHQWMIPSSFGIQIVVGGHTMPFGRDGAPPARTPVPGLGDAYEAYARDGFPPQVYREVMDNSGIDYMIAYPTVGLFTTMVPDMDAEMATAIKRAYNSWLGDFCSEAGGRVFGAASIDLRDPQRGSQRGETLYQGTGLQGSPDQPNAGR